MAQPFTNTSIIGEIVNQLPKAADYFKANRIDFCCGGDRPLNEAVEKQGLDIIEVLDRLNNMYHEMNTDENEENWMEKPLTEIVGHIIQTHHRFLREELPQLSPYVTKVEKVHGANHPHLKTVHALFHQLKTELEQHIMKEEVEVFPLIVAYEKNPTEKQKRELLTKLSELENEHDGAGDILKTLRDITNAFTPPENACQTYQLVYRRLEMLEDDTFKHVHLENNILFKRIAN